MLVRRKCIFTDEEADYKAVVCYNDKQNWAKGVPCTKEYWERHLKDKHLNRTQMELVETFFEKELALVKVNNLERKMESLRERLEYDSTINLSVILSDLEKTQIKKSQDVQEEVQDAFKKPSLEKLDKLKEEMTKIKKKIPSEELVDIIDDIEVEPQELCPKCSTVIQDAPGIGPFCPSKNCPVGDAIDLYKKDTDNQLTESQEEVKIKKTVVKRKPNLWG